MTEMGVEVIENELNAFLVSSSTEEIMRVNLRPNMQVDSSLLKDECFDSMRRNVSEHAKNVMNQLVSEWIHYDYKIIKTSRGMTENHLVSFHSDEEEVEVNEVRIVTGVADRDSRKFSENLVGALDGKAETGYSLGEACKIKS